MVRPETALSLRTSTPPRALDAIFGCAGDGRFTRSDQLAAHQIANRALHRAFRKSGQVGDGLMTQRHALRAASAGLPPQVEINQKGRGRFVVTDKVAHQYVEHVGVERELCHQDSIRGSLDSNLAGWHVLDTYCYRVLITN